jgi:hypothetical protein
LKVSLTAGDRRLLSRRHKLRLSLRVRYAAPDVSAQTASVGLTVMSVLRHWPGHARRATANATGRTSK